MKSYLRDTRPRTRFDDTLKTHLVGADGRPLCGRDNGYLAPVDAPAKGHPVCGTCSVAETWARVRAERQGVAV